MKIIDLNTSKILAQTKKVISKIENDLPEIGSKKYNLAEQKNIKNPTSPNSYNSTSQLDKKEQGEDIQNCRSYLLCLVGQKNYSVVGATQKAIDKGYAETVVETIITEFVSKKWLDDERMATNIVEFYSGNKGQIWIMQKLLKKQIPKAICQAVLHGFEQEADYIDQSGGDYSFLNKPKSLAPSESVKNLIERKYKITNWQNIDPKIKNKIIYFLTSRGFVGVYNILHQWQN